MHKLDNHHKKKINEILSLLDGENFSSDDVVNILANALFHVVSGVLEDPEDMECTFQEVLESSRRHHKQRYPPRRNEND